MPDTSAVDLGAWQTAALGLVTGLGLLATGIGTWLGKRAQKQSPIAPHPEAAGVAMALIDAKVQAEIAADTARTAEASEAAANTLVRVEDIMRKFIEDAEEAREQQEKRDLEDRAEKAEREADRLQRMLDDSRRNAGPYTTTKRPSDILRDE